MIQLKATCLRCGGMGFIHDNPTASLLCPDCNGEGTLILTSQNWDISLERVPPFSLKEIGEMKKGGQYDKYRRKIRNNAEGKNGV